jgi:hypothetical protein
MSALEVKQTSDWRATPDGAGIEVPSGLLAIAAEVIE